MSTNNLAPSSLSIESLKREIPIAVAYLVAECEVVKKWENKDCVRLELNGKKMVLSNDDFELAEKLARNCRAALAIGKKSIIGHEKLLECVKLSQDMIRDTSAAKVLMVRGKSPGSAYWRMSLPASYLGHDIDISYGIDIPSAMRYDTVMVQMPHTWESFYVLKKLKSFEKRLIYEIDDDIFSIDSDNPSYSLFGNDEKAAALACMELADYVTVSTEYLGWKLDKLGVKNIVVVPNSISLGADTEKFVYGSPDKSRRILWYGSSTHDDDWNECLDAVIKILKNRSDIKLLILGGMPKTLQYQIGGLTKQVEFQPFVAPESLSRILKATRADVGLAPLKDSEFTRSKSNLHFLEYAKAGIPIVASYVEPYKVTINNSIDGLLVKEKSDWERKILDLTDRRVNGYSLVCNARKAVKDSYSIEVIADTWKEILGLV